MLKRILFIFVVSFALNGIWERLHSLLYVHYKGGQITQMILLRATLADAAMITLIALPFLLIPYLKNKSWIIIPVGLVLALGIEWWALGSGRWAYTSLMPLIPIISVGLTPAVQLGLLGYITFRLSERL
jgi:hypothetical protein